MYCNMTTKDSTEKHRDSIAFMIRCAVTAKLITTDEAQSVADIMSVVISQPSVHSHDQLVDLCVRAIDLICHCKRTPSYEGQQLAALLTTEVSETRQ